MFNTEPSAKILAVDDNPEILDILKILLTSQGYTVELASNGTEALEKLTDDTDLVILDIMMPGPSGLKTCEEIRKTSNVPVLFLTAKTQDSDKSLGLLIGGDDYLAKPFSHAELSARVKALLRRYQVYKGKETVDTGDYLVFDTIRINRSSNEVFLNDQELNLSETEYQLLKLMASYPKKIFSAQNLYESIWNEPYFYSSNNTVMVHIHKLRNKLESNPQNPKHILTVWGKGYRFE